MNSGQAAGLGGVKLPGALFNFVAPIRKVVLIMVNIGILQRSSGRHLKELFAGMSVMSGLKCDLVTCSKQANVLGNRSLLSHNYGSNGVPLPKE